MRSRLAICALAAVLALSFAEAASAARCDGSRWIGAWTTSHAYADQRVFEDQTLRLIVNPTIGGKVLRVRLSNRFGTAPLELGRVRVAHRSAGAALVPGSGRSLRFRGRAGVTIAPGATATSDGASLRFRGGQDLAVTVHVRRATGGVTAHAGSQQTSYLAAGDQAAATSGTSFAQTFQPWYLVAGVDIRASKKTGAVVAFGASSVDGTGSPLNANHRWTDFLARRLRALKGAQRLSVLNAGIAGNRLLRDSAGPFGPSLLSRVGYDVLAQPGVSDVLVWLGSGNDFRIPPPATAAQVIDGLKRLTARLHRKKLNVIVGTISSSAGSSFPTVGGIAALNAFRRGVNDWIRTSGTPDAVVDLEAVLRDPARPDFLNPAYDSSDGQHPNSAGYRAAAKAVKLSRLKGPACARRSRGR